MSITTEFIDNTSLNLASPFADMPLGFESMQYCEFAKSLREVVLRYSPSIKFKIVETLDGNSLHVSVKAF